MGKTIGYLRVSSDKQTVDNQRLAILDYCQKNDLRVDDWIEVNMSARRTPTQRRIDELLDRLKNGDCLVVAELSRLARSVGQIAVTINTLLKNKVRFISIKENIKLKLGLPTKCQPKFFKDKVALLFLPAENEGAGYAECSRDLLEGTQIAKMLDPCARGFKMLEIPPL